MLNQNIILLVIIPQEGHSLVEIWTTWDEEGYEVMRKFMRHFAHLMDTLVISK